MDEPAKDSKPSIWWECATGYFQMPKETATMAKGLNHLTEHVRAGSPELNAMVEEAAKDTPDGSNGLAMMQRCIQANEALLKAMRDFRSAVVRRHSILKQQEKK